MRSASSLSRSTVFFGGAFVFCALGVACGLNDGGVAALGPGETDGGRTLADGAPASGDGGNVTNDAGSGSDDGGSTDPDSGSKPDGGGVGGYTFAAPLQVDFSGIYNVDAVASGANNGASFPPLTPVDAAGYAFMSHSYGNGHGSALAGLPDNGQYPPTTDHPKAQFNWRDNTAVNNAVLLNAASPNNATSVSFNVPSTTYTKLQIYGTSTEGSQTATVTLKYTDSSTTSASVNVPDWSTSTPASPVFVLQQLLGRHSSSEAVNNDANYAVFGVNVNVESGKTLTTVTVQSGGGTSHLVLFGATAY